MNKNSKFQTHCLVYLKIWIWYLFVILRLVFEICLGFGICGLRFLQMLRVLGGENPTQALPVFSAV
jgi:hypothetical protein